MKRFWLFSLLLVIFAGRCSAQEVNTVAQCRAYREAWLTSADYDTKSPSVKKLLHRANQMKTCVKEIDSQPLKAGMTHMEAATALIEHVGYATLALAYYEEAFNRAAWFIDNKNLGREFVAKDEAGKIRRALVRHQHVP